MEQSFHGKQGCSVLGEHNSHPTDDVSKKFLTVRLLKSEGVLKIYMYNKQKRWRMCMVNILIQIYQEKLK
jgi:hypothetical protein